MTLGCVKLTIRTNQDTPPAITKGILLPEPTQSLRFLQQNIIVNQVTYTQESEAETSELKVPTESETHVSSSWGENYASSPDRKSRHTPSALFQEGTNPTHEGPTLMTRLPTRRALTSNNLYYGLDVIYYTTSPHRLMWFKHLDNTGQ